MQDIFQTTIQSSEKVAIVGVNPHIADKHIWDCLAVTTAEIFFCGDKSAFDRWSTGRRKANSHYLKPYFADSVEKLVEIVLS